MVKDNIEKLRLDILSACHNSGQDPEKIIVLAIVKNRTIAQIQEVIGEGIVNIGESKVQEAIAHYNELRFKGLSLCWHMVGHLQTNKVKEAVRIFDLIHSVDTLRLAKEISLQAARINKVQDVLIQINTSGEQTKFGLSPSEAEGTIKELALLKDINIKGLMTIAPFSASPEEMRSCFRNLRELRDKINTSKILPQRIEILSMGMSDDFRIAIEEGANMLRIGRRIFQAP